MFTEYRAATDEDLKVLDGNFPRDECYDTLVGPDGFECCLTEPEDRNWHRDGKVVVAELNRQRAEIYQLKRRIDMMVSGFRSHLADLITRIGPARRPEDIKAKLEEIHNSYNAWGDSDPTS